MKSNSRLKQLVADGWLKAVGDRVYISWDDNDIVSMLKNAGDRKSSESCGDSDALETDPVWDWSQRTGGSIEFEVNQKDLGRTKVSYILALVLGVAAEMTEDDICVIFGRDMYPAQAAMAAWADLLPGTWIYWEGLSRDLVGGESSETLQGAILPMMTSKTKVFGVDTGFNGTIPFRGLSRCHEVGELRVRLLSSGSEDLRVFSEESEDSEGESAVRKVALSIEHYPKPFMRAVECFDGLPVLRLSREKDIKKAVAYWSAVHAKASELRKEVPYLLMKLNEGHTPSACEQSLTGAAISTSQLTWSIGDNKHSTEWGQKRSPFLMKQALKVPAKKKEKKTAHPITANGCGGEKCSALSRMLKTYADEQNKKATLLLAQVDLGVLEEKKEIPLGITSISRKHGWYKEVEAWAVPHLCNPKIEWRSKENPLKAG